jgi:probable O-glycosylation ligase (exosortase A-associated)
MNPHRLTWSHAVKYFPVAQYVGIATLLGYLFTKERDKLPLEREVMLLMLLWAFYTFTSCFGLSASVWNEWSRTSKILLFTFMTIILCIDKQKIKSLLLIIAFSIGFYGIKGTIFSVLTGGDNRVWGPEDSFIEDNNDLGLALLMVMPILLYISKMEENKKLQLLLRISFCSCVVAALFTYSRGTFLGLVVLFIALLYKSQKKVLSALFVGIAIACAVMFVPEKLVNRMESIKTYQQDRSAMGRINAWHFAWNLALDRPFVGGGFGVSEKRIFQLYAPDPLDFHASHSIYFEVLGEHGFVGLGLFLALLISSILSVKKLKKNFKYLPSFQWLCNYCDMIELSLLAYMVSGAFLGRAYFDLYYHMISIVVILKVLAKREYESFVKEQSFYTIAEQDHTLGLAGVVEAQDEDARVKARREV